MGGGRCELGLLWSGVVRELRKYKRLGENGNLEHEGNEERILERELVFK